MFVSKKIISGILIFLLLIGCFALTISRVSTTSAREFATIVVDAGHGGIDGGVQSESGIKESDLNLEIAKMLQKSLEKDGVKVVMTREHKGAIASNKKADMQRRREIIRNTNPDVVISIHVNKFSDKRRRGVQVFYDDTKKWQKEGTIMQGVMNEYINKKYTSRSDLLSIGGDYFMTKCIDKPSLIIECGFISNSDDLRLLQSEEYREQLVKYIKVGIYSILEY